MNHVLNIHIKVPFTGTFVDSKADFCAYIVEAIHEYFRMMTLGEREFMQMDACYRRDLKKS